MKKLMIIVFALVSLFGIASCNFLPNDTQTTTEPITVDTDNYIDIATIEDLQNIEMNLSYRLVADLDLADMEWTPLGSFDTPYLGNFDGNGHTISNLTITVKNDYLNGLFAYVKGEVVNLTLTGVNIDYTSDFITYAGGISGMTDGTLNLNTVEGTIHVNNTLSNTYAGLLTGFSSGKNPTDIAKFERNYITNNTVSGSIDVDSGAIAFVGGLAGKTFNSSVVGNVSDADITVVADGVNVPVYVGGFVGHNYGGVLIDFGSSDIEDPNIYVKNNISFSTVQVTNESSNIYVGGFMGFNQASYLIDNFSQSDITVSGEMQEANTAKIAGFLGENFEAQADSNLAMITIDTSNYTNTANVDAYVAGAYTDYQADNTYIYNPGSVALQDNGDDITEATMTDLVDSAFYQDDLGWMTSMYSLIITKLDAN